MITRLILKLSNYFDCLYKIGKDLFSTQSKLLGQMFPKKAKKRKIFINSPKNAEFSDFLEMVDPTPNELREAAEKNVLRYLIALIYDQSPKRMILERGITFTPMCPEEFTTEDPAALSAVLMVDFDNSDPSSINANFLAPSSG